MKRVLDIVSTLILLVVFSLPAIIIALLVKLEGEGPILFWSQRVGKDNQLFWMPKFRTMKEGTPKVASHLLHDCKNHITLLGQFLRKTSLDEIPQFYSILKGEMSLIGPRPALYNQDDLVKLRSEQGVQQILPGLTGLAQVKGRDEIPMEEKVHYDIYYLKHRNLWLDIKIIILTVSKVILRKNITH